MKSTAVHLRIVAALIVMAALAAMVIPQRRPVEAAGSAPVTVTNTPLPVAAAQSGLWNVGIAGTPSVNVASVPAVHDADNPARQPFGIMLCLPFGDDSVAKCQALGQPSSFQVPAGKELAVEQISGVCSTTTGVVLLSVVASTQTGGTSLVHRLPVTYPAAADTTRSLVFETTRMYADAGSLMSLEIGDATSPGPPPVPPQLLCALALSGHFVDR